MEIKKLEADSIPQFKALLNVFNVEFEVENPQMADDSRLKELLSNKTFICIVALIDDKVVGGLTAYEILSYTDNYSEAYIYDIAVSKEHQRKGIGNMLIAALKSYCKEHNIKTIFVEAHEQDTGAVNFYHGTKASAEKVVHFNYYL